MHSSRVGVDDVDKSGLQASTSNKEAVDISLLCELGAVLLCDATTVENAGLLCSFGGYVLLQPLTDRSVNLLCLLGGGDLSSANGPVILLDKVELYLGNWQCYQMGS